LEKSAALPGGDHGFNYFFLAMTQWRLGNKDQARKWYDQAVQWQEKNLESLNQYRRDELRRFGVEAEELLKGTEK
jgi:hypothetical protein